MTIQILKVEVGVVLGGSIITAFSDLRFVPDDGFTGIANFTVWRISDSEICTEILSESYSIDDEISFHASVSEHNCFYDPVRLSFHVSRAL